MYTWFTVEKHSVVVACRDETQQELIPFKHKERWVVELVLLKLTVTEIDGVRRQDARELTAPVNCCVYAKIEARRNI